MARDSQRFGGGSVDYTAYRCEDGSETSPLVDRAALMGNILLENPEIETRWYFKYFLGHHHKNLIAFITSRDGELEPVRWLFTRFGSSP